jgi:hypothetical protein
MMSNNKTRRLGKGEAIQILRACIRKIPKNTILETGEIEKLFKTTSREVIGYTHKMTLRVTDYCYNITNENFIKSYPDGIHLFEHKEKNKLIVLKENYPYTGSVTWAKRNDGIKTIGHWNNGVFTFNEEFNPKRITNGSLTAIKKDIFSEGGSVEQKSRRYERSAVARKVCIEHYKALNNGIINCRICGVSFGETYGKEFVDKIEVHHISPVSLMDETHDIIPEQDLLPVCANCHFVLHSSKEAYSIDYVGALINENKKKRYITELP